MNPLEFVFIDSSIRTEMNYADLRIMRFLLWEGEWFHDIIPNK